MGTTASIDRAEGIRLTGFVGYFGLRGGFNGTFRARVNGEAPVQGTWPATAAPAAVSPALQAALVNNAASTPALAPTAAPLPTLRTTRALTSGVLAL